VHVLRERARDAAAERILDDEVQGPQQRQLVAGDGAGAEMGVGSLPTRQQEGLNGENRAPRDRNRRRRPPGRSRTWRGPRNLPPRRPAAVSPFSRAGAPREIAEVIRFLASGQA
jgi:hypothetical protein